MINEPVYAMAEVKLNAQIFKINDDRQKISKRSYLKSVIHDYQVVSSSSFDQHGRNINLISYYTELQKSTWTRGDPASCSTQAITESDMEFGQSKSLLRRLS